MQQEPLSPCPGVAGCRPRGSRSARAGAALPAACPGRGEEVPGPLPVPGSVSGARGGRGPGVDAAADLLRRVYFCVRAEVGGRKRGYKQILRQVK